MKKSIKKLLKTGHPGTGSKCVSGYKVKHFTQKVTHK